MFRELIEKILVESKKANKQESVQILEEIFEKKFPDLLESWANTDETKRFNSVGYLGEPDENSADKIGQIPVVFLFDDDLKEKDELESYQYYLMYILTSDRKGIYLSLNYGQDYIKQILVEEGVYDNLLELEINEKLSETVQEVRETIEIPENFSKNIDLKAINVETSKNFEAASICSKYYSLENLPHENDLIHDFETLLGLYYDLTESKSFDKSIWKVSLGSKWKSKRIWPDLLERGYIGVGWFGCEYFKDKSYSRYNSYSEIKKDLRIICQKANMGFAAAIISNFGINMKVGDILVATRGFREAWGIGIIKSDYIPPSKSKILGIDKDNDYLHFREVEWKIKDKIEISENIFFGFKVSKIDDSKWNKIKSACLEQYPNYKTTFNEIDPDIPDPENLQTSLRYILKNYLIAKNHELEENKQKLFENFLQEQLPEYLGKLTANEYKIYSTLNDKLHYCPYLALMDEKITSSFNQGIYVNYMFCEDMSGVYLALMQGVSDIKKELGSEAIKILKNDSQNYRLRLNPSDKENFQDKLDLKAKKEPYAPFYEAATIISKLYQLPELPSQKQLEYDLKEILKIYNKLCENDFLKFLKKIYHNEIKIGLNELERGKNIIFYGPPGSGKTVLSKIISEQYSGKNGYSLYTVHSGTDYYDLVSRIVPEVHDGNITYSKEKRFLLDALLSEKVLILDEINRTQIDTALGIFFTYLEREHRLNDAEHIGEILLKEAGEKVNMNYLNYLLDKFRIIGTLNVYDKTFLFKLGDALKRRFTFIELTTPSDLVKDLKTSKEFKSEFLNAIDYKGNPNVADIIIEVFGDLNKIKPLGIGILKDAILFTSHFQDDIADQSIASLVIPFFENDLNYSHIKSILEKNNLNISLSKLNSLSFGISDKNGL